MSQTSCAMTDSFDPLPVEQRPLCGIKVLDFAQFLAGPVAAMRLADLGADVIKVERPNGGDACRQLVINDQTFGDDSVLFHTYNRGKRSFAADLKSPGDLNAVRALIAHADVMIHNFRPGVMERIGLGYDAVSGLNPRLVYGVVNGYGTKGPWRDKPGQDLLLQALSGMTWLSGHAEQGPVPVGMPLVDIAAAGNLTQGVLSLLLRRVATGRGGLVEVDMMSSAIDLQSEHLTAYLNGERHAPQRSCIANANVYGAAPYGIYRASDGYLAIAMTPLARLAELLQLPALEAFAASDIFSRRDEIKAIVAEGVGWRSVGDLISVLEPADIWCAKVFDWEELANSDGFAELHPLQEVTVGGHHTAVATRCPIRLDGGLLTSPRGAPTLGADTRDILAEIERTGNTDVLEH